LYKGDGGLPDGYDETLPDKDSDYVEKSLKPNKPLGRPADHERYGTHDHPMGYDPIGAKEVNKVNKIADSVKKSFVNKKTVQILKETYNTDTEKNTNVDFLDETNIMDNE
jgi:hypothetical protein